MSDQDTSTTDAVGETSADSTEATATGATTETDAPEGAESLGDAGKKALDAMKAKWKAAESTAKETERKLAELQAKIDGKEAEHQASIEAQRIKDEALAAANERIVGAELRAAAKGKVADDVLQDLSFFIKPSDFEVGDDGSVDTDAIGRAVDDLIKNKPSLAAQGKRFQGSADGGARKDATTVGQLTEADVKRLSSEGRHEEIVKAREEGRLRDYLASP